jgi:hypothetical protein
VTCQLFLANYSYFEKNKRLMISICCVCNFFFPYGPCRIKEKQAISSSQNLLLFIHFIKRTHRNRFWNQRFAFVLSSVLHSHSSVLHLVALQCGTLRIKFSRSQITTFCLQKTCNIALIRLNHFHLYVAESATGNNCDNS